MTLQRFLAAGLKAGKPICALALFPLLSSAQMDPRHAGAGPAGGVIVSASKEKPSKNLITLEELNTLDQKFHGELDAAQEAAGGERFADAQQQFTQLSGEVDELLKRIAIATFPKNSKMTVNGEQKPVTIQLETEWFGRTRDKAERGKAEASVLGNVDGIRKQADELLKAKKYPDDLETYKKAADVLGASKAQVPDDSYRFFLTRLVNGEKDAVTTYWGDVFASLRDRYNKSTDDQLTPAQAHEIIQGVVKEITDKGYLDAAKHPDMPDNVRGLFQTVSDAANKYLAQ